MSDQPKKPFQTRPARVTIVTTPLPSRRKTQVAPGNLDQISSNCDALGAYSNGNTCSKPVDNFSESKAEQQDCLSRGTSDAPKEKDPFIRAENEDDDGYDPYSDRPEARPLFEPNPWS